MLEYFDDHPHIKHRALQIWQILVGKAHNRQTLTYQMLAKLLGYGGSGVLGGHLEPVALYCRQNGLPPLTTLAVEKYSGLPSVDLTNNDLNADREEVFRLNWYSVYPPTAEDFALAKERGWHYQQPV